MSSINCRVVTPTGVLFDGEAASLAAPGFTGGLGVLPGHAPYLVRLESGRLVLKDESGAESFGLDLVSGYLLVARNEATMLIEELAEND